MLDDWKTTGACVDHPNMHWWHSDDPGHKRQAAEICDGCPVKAACRELAVRSGREHGIWGGLLFQGTGRPHRVKPLRERYDVIACGCCLARFRPEHGNQLYCSQRCSNVAKTQRRAAGGGRLTRPSRSSSPPCSSSCASFEREQRRLSPTRVQGCAQVTPTGLCVLSGTVSTVAP